MSCRPVWLLWSVLITIAVPASAHPGHGTPGGEASPSHYLTEPIHALVLVAVLAACVAAGSWIAQKSRRRTGFERFRR